MIVKSYPEYLARVWTDLSRKSMTVIINNDCKLCVAYNEITITNIDKFVFAMLDKDGFFAKEYEVSVDNYLAWKHAMDVLKCTGTTSKGLPCNKRLARFYNPHKFVRGFHDRCASHVDLEVCNKEISLKNDIIKKRSGIDNYYKPQELLKRTRCTY